MVYPSAFDYGNTEGLCGNFNDIASDSDDKVLRDSATNGFDSGSYSHETQLTEYNAFLESWRYVSV